MGSAAHVPFGSKAVLEARQDRRASLRRLILCEMSPNQNYRLYLDESGDHVFRLIDDDHHRYLGLIGVWFDVEGPYRTFAWELQELKASIFGCHPDDEPLCLHRKDMVQRRGVFGVLKNPDVNRRLEEGLMDLLGRAEFRMTCVVLDKKEYAEPAHPYHACISVLLEQYAGWLETSNGKGDVMAESRGSREDNELRSAFERTIETGTRLCSPDQIQRVLTSGKLKLKKKEHDIAGLQIADLLAYPLRREMVCEQGSRQPPQDFSAALLDVARPKLYCHPGTGEIEGYGKIRLPKSKRAPA